MGWYDDAKGRYHDASAAHATGHPQPPPAPKGVGMSTTVKVLIFGGLIVTVLGVLISALASSSSDTSSPSAPGGQKSSSEPEPGWRSRLAIIGPDVSALGPEISSGFGPRTDALCAKLATDVSEAGAADGWTPTEGKTATGTDGRYVDLLNQAHQVAEACTAHDVETVTTHLGALTAAAQALSTS